MSFCKKYSPPSRIFVRKPDKLHLLSNASWKSMLLSPPATAAILKEILSGESIDKYHTLPADQYI